MWGARRPAPPPLVRRAGEPRASRSSIAASGCRGSRRPSAGGPFPEPFQKIAVSADSSHPPGSATLPLRVSTQRCQEHGATVTPRCAWPPQGCTVPLCVSACRGCSSVSLEEFLSENPWPVYPFPPLAAARATSGASRRWFCGCLCVTRRAACAARAQGRFCSLRAGDRKLLGL